MRSTFPTRTSAYEEQTDPAEETLTEGVENAPEAFIGLFKGDKLGKALVKI